MKYSAITQTATYTIPNNLNVHYTITVDKDLSDDTTGKLKTEFLVNLRTILSEFKLRYLFWVTQFKIIIEKGSCHELQQIA